MCFDTEQRFIGYLSDACAASNQFQDAILNTVHEFGILRGLVNYLICTWNSKCCQREMGF